MKYTRFLGMLIAFIVIFTVLSSAQSKNCTNCSSADRAKCTVMKTAASVSNDQPACDAKLAANCPIKDCPVCPHKQAMKSSTRSTKGSMEKSASVVRALDHQKQATGKKAVKTASQPKA